MFATGNRLLIVRLKTRVVQCRKEVGGRTPQILRDQIELMDGVFGVVVRALDLPDETCRATDGKRDTALGDSLFPAFLAHLVDYISVDCRFHKKTSVNECKATENAYFCAK